MQNIHFRTEASVPWTVDQWWSKRVVDCNMQRANGSRGAVSPRFKLLNPIKTEARSKFHVFLVVLLCECNYCGWHKSCIKSWVKKEVVTPAVLGGCWSREPSESLWRLSKTLTLEYLLLPNWVLTGEALGTEMKIVTWGKNPNLNRIN